jgi:acyl-CoA oxidase
MTSRVLNLHGDLPQETLALIQKAKSWGEQELEPLIPKHWEEATFPPHILESFQRHCPQLLGYTLPKKYGGAGYDLLTACHISKTLASIDASFTTALLVQYGLCAESILLCGSEEQKHRFLPTLARLEHMGCFCLTEPQSGSDASDLRTAATKISGGYRISGSKRWIGNALTSEVFVVWARNTSLKGNPVMGFIVQRSQQSDPRRAIQATKIEGKVSLRITQNANIEFCDAFCPDANVMHGFGKYLIRDKTKFDWTRYHLQRFSLAFDQLGLENLWDEYWKLLGCLWLGYRLVFAWGQWRRLSNM